MRVNHEQVQLFFVVLMMNGGDEHSAGIDAHHRTRGQVHNGNAGLSDKVFGLIISVNSAQNGSFGARAVIEREFEKLFRLRNGFAGENLDSAEIGLREGLKIDGVREERLNSDLREVYLFFVGGSLFNGRGSFFGLLVRVKRFERRDSDRNPELSGIIKHLRAFHNN